MKIKIKKNLFLNSIKSANNIINHNDINPVLSSIHFQALNKQLTIIATNGSDTFQQKINDVTIFQEGQILIKGKFIYNIISKIEQKEIELNQIDTNLLQIKTSNFLCEINLVENNYFPIVDFDYQNCQKIILKQEIIFNVLKKIMIFLPTVADNQFNTINGICFNTIGNNQMECLATNRIAIGYYKFNYEGDKVKFVISQEAIKIINDIILSQKNNQVEIYLNDKKTIIKLNDILLSFSLFEDNYPNIADKILSKQNYFFTVSTSNLLNALNRGSSFVVNELKPIVNFVITPKSLHIKFNSIEIGNSFEEINFLDKNIDSIEFKLNQKIIQQIISTIDHPEVTFNFNGKNKPIIITSKNSDFLNLIMPFSIN